MNDDGTPLIHRSAYEVLKAYTFKKNYQNIQKLNVKLYEVVNPETDELFEN
jgi:hypothetical protein